MLQLIYTGLQLFDALPIPIPRFQRLANLIGAATGEAIEPGAGEVGLPCEYTGPNLLHPDPERLQIRLPLLLLLEVR